MQKKENCHGHPKAGLLYFEATNLVPSSSQFFFFIKKVNLVTWFMP
jgi:hypothetical protein